MKIKKKLTLNKKGKDLVKKITTLNNLLEFFELEIDFTPNDSLETLIALFLSYMEEETKSQVGWKEEYVKQEWENTQPNIDFEELEVYLKEKK